MRLCVAFLILIFSPMLAFSANTASVPQNNIIYLQQLTNPAFNFYILSTLKIKEIEKSTGRKLTLKEKISFKIFQWQIKRELKVPEAGVKDNGKTAFILGLVGLISLFIPVLNLASIPLAILAIVIGNKAKRENPYDKKARTAVKLGIITLALLVIIGFLVAIVLAFGTIGPG